MPCQSNVNACFLWQSIANPTTIQVGVGARDAHASKKNCTKSTLCSASSCCYYQALFELTCPLERNIYTANTYKRDKYSGMQGDLEDKGWKVHLVPYEVSSRGQILKSTKSSIITTLKQFKIKIKAEQLMLKK